MFRQGVSEQVRLNPNLNDLGAFPRIFTPSPIKGRRENFRITLQGSQGYVVLENMGFRDRSASLGTTKDYPILMSSSEITETGPKFIQLGFALVHIMEALSALRALSSFPGGSV